MSSPTNSTEAYALIDALSPRQEEMLSAIAVGLDGGHHPKTVAALVKRGLVWTEEATLAGRFPVIVYRYYVPIFVHIAWAQWASEQPDEEKA